MIRRAGQPLARLPLHIRIGALAMLLSSCGVLGGPTDAEAISAMLSSAETTQVNLSQAVGKAVASGQTTSADATPFITRTTEALEAFNQATDSFRGETALRDEAESYAQSANLVLGLLGEGNIAVAAEVAETQVTAKFQSLSSDLRARQDALGGPPSAAGGITRIVVVAMIVAGVAAVVLTRMRPVPDGVTPPPPVRRPEEPPQFPAGFLPDDPLSSLSSTLPPIGSEPPRPAEPTGPLRNPEAIHSVKGGLRTVELEGIIEAALATVTNTGWEVAIQCPQVRVLVDPLRMRRLLSNLLLSATAHGAEHIGLVAEIVGDKVEVNVGHDGTLLAETADPTSRLEAPPEVEHQMTVARQLLQGMHADVRWTRWNGVSLYTVELVRGPDEVPDGPVELIRIEG